MRNMLFNAYREAARYGVSEFGVKINLRSYDREAGVGMATNASGTTGQF
eukprot:gene41084-2880_t